MTTNYPIDIESFARYSTPSDLYERVGPIQWTSQFGLSLTTGAFGNGKGIGGSHITGTLATPVSEFYIGYYNSCSVNAPTDISFYNSSGPTFSFGIYYNYTNGQITVRDSNFGTILYTTGNFVFPVNSWFFSEVGAKLHASAGFITVKVNGATVVNLTSIDTIYNSITSIDEFAIGLNSDVANVSDLYLATTGFVGEGRAIMLPVNGNGSTDNFTPSTGSNYQNVDGTFQTTNFNSSSTVNNLDLFTVDYSSLQSGTPILGVNLGNYSWKDNSGARGLTPIAKQSSTTHSLSENTLTPTGQGYTQMMSQNPISSSDWVYGDFATTQFGYKLTT